MKIIIANDYEHMSKIASDLVIKEINLNPKSILGLATGGTPEGTYKNLINEKNISWKEIITFNLDEYIDVDPENKVSYRYYMNNKLFKHIDIDIANTFVPIGQGDIAKNCKSYDDLIDKKGGIDIQILGIGINGHIAFNEPGTDPKLGTTKVKLTDSTIEANSKYFNNKNEVPNFAITMGIGKILESKKIILLASGKAKAQAILNTIEGKVNIDVPSSYLQNHDNVIIIADKDAASLLTNNY